MSHTETAETLFRSLSPIVDKELRSFFEALPKLPLYDHLAYFMGFRDESLSPVTLQVGKRFRPIVTLMLSRWYGVEEKTMPAALSLELFHNFSLIHDDVVDGDTLRRGRPTVWKLFGTDHAINSGDGQLLLSLKCLYSEGPLTAEERCIVLAFLMNQYQRVIEGQFFDFEFTKATIDNPVVTEQAYYEVIGRKTADLIAAATGVSGIIAKVDHAEQCALFDFGYQLGIGYQLADDILSIWGDTEKTGKDAYGDIRERKKTIPIIRLYAESDPDTKKKIALLYKKEGTLSETDIDFIRSKLDEGGFYERIRTDLTEALGRTYRCIDQLSLQSEEKQILHEVVNMLLPEIKGVD